MYKAPSAAVCAFNTIRGNLQERIYQTNFGTAPHSRMADAVARREARRKRILENSENRLEKISGLIKIDVTKDLPQHKHVLLPTPITNSDKADESDPVGSMEDRHSSVSCGDAQKESKNTAPFAKYEAYPSDLPSSSDYACDSSESIHKETEVSQPSAVKVFPPQLHLVGFAVIVRLLLSCNYGFLFGESIFVPLFTVQLMKHIGVFPDANNADGKGGALSAALILSGVPAQRIAIISKSVTALRSFLDDFCIYFFCFIVLHVFLEFL